MRPSRLGPLLKTHLDNKLSEITSFISFLADDGSSQNLSSGSRNVYSKREGKTRLSSRSLWSFASRENQLIVLGIAEKVAGGCGLRVYQNMLGREGELKATLHLAFSILSCFLFYLFCFLFYFIFFSIYSVFLSIYSIFFSIYSIFFSIYSVFFPIYSVFFSILSVFFFVA